MIIFTFTRHILSLWHNSYLTTFKKCLIHYLGSLSSFYRLEFNISVSKWLPSTLITHYLASNNLSTILEMLLKFFLISWIVHILYKYWPKQLVFFINWLLLFFRVFSKEFPSIVLIFDSSLKCWLSSGWVYRVRIGIRVIWPTLSRKERVHLSFQKSLLVEKRFLIQWIFNSQIS